MIAPPVMTYCYLIRRRETPWLALTCCDLMDRRINTIWPWPRQCILAAFLLWNKFIISFRFGPPSNTVLGWGVGGPTSQTLLSENARRGTHTRRGRLLAPSSNPQMHDNFPLFSKICWLLVFFNGSSSSPYLSASFSYNASKSGLTTHIVQ